MSVGKQITKPISVFVVAVMTMAMVVLAGGTASAANSTFSVVRTAYTNAPGGFDIIGAGTPVTYDIAPTIATGDTTLAGPVTVRIDSGSGVRLIGATGANWVCGTPTLETWLTCTRTAGPFAPGSALGTINAVGIVGLLGTTATNARAVGVTVSATGANTFTSNTATTGINPTAPTITSVTPSRLGPQGNSPVTISGTNLTGATSILLGGLLSAVLTPTALFPCPGNVPAVGCFNTSGNNLVISSMPPHVIGAINIRVVNKGTSADGNFEYVLVPPAPVVTATGGVNTATVSWLVPNNNPDAITLFLITVYRNGQLLPDLSLTLDISDTHSKTFNNLVPGTYTFGVAATNILAYGDIGISNPVTVIGASTAPLNPSAAASSGQAVVSWQAPSDNGGSAITGYVVTPYIGATAQTPQTFNSTDLSQTVTGLTPGSTYTFTVQAINAAGPGAASVATNPVTINALPTLSIPTPVAGEVSVAYTNPAFPVTGGTGPFTWSVDSGSLPAGITLSSAGVLSGTPTVSGTFNFTVRVTDGAGKTATQALTLTIAALPTLTNPAPPAGQRNVPYSDQLTVNGGTGPFGWSLSAGSLPAGLTLSSGGLISGTPTTVGGPTTFTVRVQDTNGKAATQVLNITIGASPSLSFPAPPSGQVNVPYSNTLVVTGGTAPFTWSFTGNLPPGLTLNATTGTISGTPTTAGTFTSLIRVQDSTGQFATKSVSLVISASPQVTFSPPSGEIGVAYTATPGTTGGTGPFTFTISSGTLPAGLTINSATGVVSGTPTAAGSSTVTVHVVDSFGQSADSNAANITIFVAPTLDNPAQPAGDVGVEYDSQLQVTGGNGPFTWSISAGALPAGLTLDALTGEITGTPTAGGTSTFTVRVQDGFGGVATQELSIAIRGASTVSLATSTNSVDPGESVTLTATVGPGTPTGSVTFTDTLTSGPNSGSQTNYGPVPLTNGVASITIPLAEFGAHSIVASFGGNAVLVASASLPSVVEVVATAGSLLVSEFRLSGPAGATDQFVELTNVGTDPVALTGFQIVSNSGAVTTLPSGSPVLPANRAFLVTGPGYSLGGVATAGYTSGASLGSGGIQVLAPDTAHTQTDAVGPSSGFHQGTGLSAFSGTPSEQFGWVRTQQTSFLKNTQNNAADFALVSTSGGPVGGVQSMLGSPSPTGFADPWLHTFSVKSSLLNPGLPSTASPNRVVTPRSGLPTLLQVRRTLTNNTGATIAVLNVRLNSLSEANGLAPLGTVPAGPTANLRAINPATATSTINNGTGNVTVQNLSVAAPATGATGGGLNTTYSVPLGGGGLAAGASVNVSFTFEAVTGGTFWFGYDVDSAGAN